MLKTLVERAGFTLAQTAGGSKADALAAVPVEVSHIALERFHEVRGARSGADLSTLASWMLSFVLPKPNH